MDDEKPDVKIFPANNDLRKKVKTNNEKLGDVVKSIEETITNMVPQYLGWAMDDWQKLNAANLDTKEGIKEVLTVAHDMKGQGGSFGFQLVTTISNIICRIIESKETLTDKEKEAVKLATKAIKLTLDDKLSGDGGPAGKKMAAGLTKVLDSL